MTITLLNNRYQILETLGQGGFGETFLAVDTHMPSARKCVIKLLKPAIQSDQIPEWLQERFRREAAVLETVGANHPQIPQLYAYFSELGNFYLVQEWIEGLTLTQKHQKIGNFTENQVQEILVKLLPVLDYLHSRRIIHRDVKPDNIILRSGDELPFLIDFGVMKEAMATMVSPDGKTAYSVALGTPGYMASEQAAGRPLYSSDLYSLGLTAVFLLTGKTPQYLDSDPRTGEFLWRKDAPQVHSALASVIDRTIRFHPRDRFASAQEMLAALTPVASIPTGATVVVNRSAVSSRPPLPSRYPVSSVSEPITNEWGWRQLFYIMLLIAGVIVGGFGLGFGLFHSKQRPTDQPSPSPTVNASPDPQTFPTVESSPDPQPTPEVVPTPTPTPSPEVEITPETEIAPSPATEIPPETEISPSPEAEIPPEIETAPSPEAEILPETEISPSPETEIPPETETSPSPATATPTSKLPPVPIFGVGSQEKSVRNHLGQPTAIKKGVWGNSRALLYKNVVPNKIDLGYLADVKTGTIKQTEISLVKSVGLPKMQRTLDNLLGGKAPSSVQQALVAVYQGQRPQSSFVVGKYHGTIEKKNGDRVYIGVWEAGFH